MKYIKELTVKNRSYRLPIYLPDGTRGVVKSLDSQDLRSVQVKGVVVNTYHLLSDPGIEVLETSKGIKEFMGWDGLVVSDSGGFQVLSLIYQDQKYGRVTDLGVIFNINSTGQKKRIAFTPERSIQTQFSIGSDILVCLDDVSALDSDYQTVRQNVKRTISWAKRCKSEFNNQLTKRKFTAKSRPLLMSVIQGGDFPDLRTYCAEELIKIGFDLYGYGGFPVDQEGNFRLDSLRLTAKLIPDQYPKFALGVGTPQNIVDCLKMGYNMFDCVLPTRDARHGRLYLAQGLLDITSRKYARSFEPVDKNCDCLTCQKHTRAYLHHLFKVGDFTAGRLASIHNLRTYTKLLENIPRD